MIKKILLSFLLFTFVTGSIYSQPASDADFENVWRDKKFSIGVGVGGRLFIPTMFILGVEIPSISYRPTEHLQLTFKSFLWSSTSFLAGYTTAWGRWRWFIEGGVNLDWLAEHPGPEYLGPEISTGAEYLINDGFAIGLRLSSSYMFYNGKVNEWFHDRIDNTLLATASFLF